MPIVYLAHNPHLDRKVAVKVLPAALLLDPWYREHFDREARNLAWLEHQAIVPIYNYGDNDGSPYRLMLLMTGGSLRDRLENGPLPPLKALTVLQRICGALDTAHQAGVTHRDLKPHCTTSLNVRPSSTRATAW
jgi:serine/threonine-protein kinase